MNTAENPFEKFWPNSSNVNRTKYMAESKILEVEFKGGKTYHYADIPLDVWDKLVAAESVGKFINSEVKNKFTVTPV